LKLISKKNKKNKKNYKCTLLIELQVADNPNFRPRLSKKIEEKKRYFEFIDLMKKFLQHDPKERPGFNEITMTLQEIQENIK
jgi:hypothetical protein